MQFTIASVEVPSLAITAYSTSRKRAKQILLRALSAPVLSRAAIAESAAASRSALAYGDRLPAGCQRKNFHAYKNRPVDDIEPCAMDYPWPISFGGRRVQSAMQA